MDFPFHLSLFYVLTSLVILNVKSSNFLHCILRFLGCCLLSWFLPLACILLVNLPTERLRHIFHSSELWFETQIKFHQTPLCTPVLQLISLLRPDFCAWGYLQARYKTNASAKPRRSTQMTITLTSVSHCTLPSRAVAEFSSCQTCFLWTFTLSPLCLCGSHLPCIQSHRY